MARGADFDLAKALALPSFTPGQRDALALVELVVGGEEPACARAQGALAKLGKAGREAIETRLAGGGAVGGDTAELGDAATARLVRALGLLARAGDAGARASLIARSADPHARVRRAAVVALGKLGGDDEIRAVLVARWDASDVTPDERRALAEALGKVGGKAAMERLAAASETDDKELERRRRRGLLMAQRTATRDEASAIDDEVRLPHPAMIVMRCKAGLAELLAEELKRHGLHAKSRDDSTVAFRLPAGMSWQRLQTSRLWMSAALEWPLVDGADIVDRVEGTLTAGDVLDNLRAMTRGALRYRLGFRQGQRRALIWQLAHALTPFGLINDPTSSTWEITVDDQRGTVELVPKKAADARFAWRVAEVPAASHPSVAAALAFVAGATASDRVWDPFCGSGAELVERAKLGAFGTLIGSDTDDRAIAAARANLTAAGVEAALERADARTFDPGAVDLIITNPPLGSRVQLDAAALLAEVLPRFARALAPGGRLVWITPAPRRTLPIGESAGLVRTRAMGVDLGGVRGTLERWER